MQRVADSRRWVKKRRKMCGRAKYRCPVEDRFGRGEVRKKKGTIEGKDRDRCKERKKEQQKREGRYSRGEWTKGDRKSK